MIFGLVRGTQSLVPLADLTSASAVEAALDEFDELGREAFLSKYEFGRARRYFVRRDGKYYDSKAIAGAAVGYQYPEKGSIPAASTFASTPRARASARSRAGSTPIASQLHRAAAGGGPRRYAPFSPAQARPPQTKRETSRIELAAKAAVASRPTTARV